MKYLIPFLFLLSACDDASHQPHGFKSVEIDVYGMNVKYIQMPDGRPCVVAAGPQKGGVSCDWSWKPGVPR